jgi:polyferredoxin
MHPSRDAVSSPRRRRSSLPVRHARTVGTSAGEQPDLSLAVGAPPTGYPFPLPSRGGAARRSMPSCGEDRPSREEAPAGVDLARVPLLAWWLRRRSWQFQLILPTQILFWVVIVTGFVGAAEFNDNFATTITWFVWFSLVFLLILVTGRGWCAVCPFGGLAEWLQRGRLWHRRGAAGRGLGAGRPAPEWLARYGYATTAVMFGVLNWIEEYYQVADDSSPARTSWTVLGIIGFALVVFLTLQRRAFCRYLCPLGGLIGVLGAGAPVTGFRSRDQRVCGECTTKDCIRGTERAYGCPWFNWPGSSESSVNCGLCGECFRSCSQDNVGLYVEKPLAALMRRQDRRADVAWTVAILGGIMVHQHLHETAWWASLDEWANGLTRLPHGPNPLLYILLTAVCVTVLMLPAWLAQHLLYRRPGGGLPWRGDSFVYRATPFRMYFLPLFYAAVPLLGFDFLAAQVLGFMQDAPKVIPAAARMLGLGPAGHGGPPDSPLKDLELMSTPAVVHLQIALLALGTLASAAVIWRTAAAEIAPVTRAPRVVQVGGALLMFLGGGLLIYFYNLTQGAAA